MSNIEIKTFVVSSCGTLSSILAAENAESLEAICIKGELDAKDIRTLARLPKLKYLDIKDTMLQYLPKSAFAKSFIEVIILPKNLKEIAERAFSQCRGLKQIDIPSGLTSIGKFAFFSCKSLKEITIPNSVTNIDFRAFVNCPSLASFNGECTLISTDKRAIIQEGVMTNFAGGDLSEYDVPQNVTELVETSFMGTSYLEKINLPDGLELINDFAFVGLNINTIEIPSSVIVIGSAAFANCFKLESVKFLGSRPPMILPSYIDEECDLREVYIYVPKDSVEAYKRARGWAEYVNNIKPY